ncbi:MAG: DUF192 domain-containing protein [Acidobacteriota bacterium]|nr:DUF192 domain-containing protein [Acidobacteriota bacterium]
MKLKILVRNRTRNTVLASSAEMADTGAKRRVGLLKHSSLKPGEGLWIVPCEAVHSFGMKFPIDVLFLDRSKKIRKTRAGMAPRRMAICLPAHSVLELPAGTIALTGTESGDQLDFQKLSAESH